MTLTFNLLTPKVDRFIFLLRGPLVPICSNICACVFKISYFTSGRVENTVHPASVDRRRYKKRKPDARDSRLGNELASRSYRIAVIMALQLQRMTGRRRRTNRNKSTEQSTERHADSVASNSSWDNSFTSNQRCADCGLQLKIRSQFEDPQTFHTQLYSPKQRK